MSHRCSSRLSYWDQRNFMWGPHPMSSSYLGFLPWRIHAWTSARSASADSASFSVLGLKSQLLVGCFLMVILFLLARGYQGRQCGPLPWDPTGVDGLTVMRLLTFGCRGSRTGHLCSHASLRASAAGHNQMTPRSPITSCPSGSLKLLSHLNAACLEQVSQP